MIKIRVHRESGDIYVFDSQAQPWNAQHSYWWSRKGGDMLAFEQDVPFLSGLELVRNKDDLIRTAEKYFQWAKTYLAAFIAEKSVYWTNQNENSEVLAKFEKFLKQHNCWLGYSPIKGWVLLDRKHPEYSDWNRPFVLLRDGSVDQLNREEFSNEPQGPWRLSFWKHLDHASQQITELTTILIPEILHYIEKFEEDARLQALQVKQSIGQYQGHYSHDWDEDYYDRDENYYDHYDEGDVPSISDGYGDTGEGGWDYDDI
jgi:hypothetical protein